MTQVFIDVETGGYDPERNAITEIGAVAFEFSEDGKAIELQRFHYYVRPARHLTVTEEAAKVQGTTVSAIYDRVYAMAETNVFFQLRAFLAKFLPNPQESDYTGRIWAHCATFDNGFLHNLESRCGVEKPIVFTARNSMSCTRELAKILRGNKTILTESTSLDGLLAYFELYDDLKAREDKHSAIDDAVCGMKVLEKLTKAMSGGI